MRTKLLVAKFAVLSILIGLSGVVSLLAFRETQSSLLEFIIAFSLGATISRLYG